MPHRKAALEILYRVWVSRGTLTLADVEWLRPLSVPPELPVDTCLRLAGYPEYVGTSTDDKRALLEKLRYDAVEANRFRDDVRFVRMPGGDWVERAVAKDEYGRKLEHPRTYFPPEANPLEEAAPQEGAT